MKQELDEEEGKASRVLSQKCLNRRKRKLEQLTPEQLQSYDLSADLQSCVKVNDLSFLFFSQACHFTVVNAMQDLDLDRALDVYNKGKASNIRPSKEAFNHVLALAAGLGEQGSGSFPPRTIEPPSNLEAALAIFRDAKEADVVIQEASYAGLIRSLALNDRPDEGLVLLREMQEQSLKMRLRSYTALLAAFCKQGNAEVSIGLFHELSVTHALEPTEKEYLSMLSLCLLVDDDEKFYAYLHSMLEDILVPSNNTWEVVKQWFSTSSREKIYRQQLDTVTTAGELEHFSHQLQSVELCESDRAQLIEQIDNCFKVTSNIEGCDLSNLKHAKTKVISEKWEQYKAWIKGDLAVAHCDAAESYNILIDGANIGFYQQNFANATGHVDYLQIDAMITHCQQMGRKPLVILHCRHLFPDVLPPNMVSVVENWKKQKLLYITPAKCNDDLFWMYAAMVFNIDVVTNDEMRDHHFKMLSPRWFMRWKERHQVRFKFGKFDHAERRRTLETIVPPSYSHRIQIYDPASTAGTTSDTMRLRTASTHYFFPSSDQPEWLCIIPITE